MILSPETQLLLITFVGVLGLIVLIARYKLHAFLALLLVSLAVGLASGMKLTDIAKAFQDGVGNTLGFIAVIVGIGTMLGKLLAESGGAEVIAGTFIRALGPRRLPIAMVIVAFVVGLPVFFGVGILLLAPIIFSLARETRLPLLCLALPMVAGLSTSHCLVPPHVGPMVAIERLGADVGKTILLSTAIGFPIALLVGLVYTKYITKTVVVTSVETTSIPAGIAAQGRKPRFAMALFTIALPVLLMLGDTVAKLGLPAENSARAWAGFLGSPIVSMFIAALFSFYSFGWACGFNRNQLLKFTEECVGPAASIMLVVGAGGGFSKVLDQAGVAKAIANLAGGLHLSPLLLGWLVAALIRVAVGSATVTITMTAAMLAPVADATPGTHRELLVIALGAGSLIASHLNDGGFWFVKEYFNMTVGQTLKTWTVLVSIISVAALLLTLLVDVIL
jgi:GntP family gluconate:H+ symporter